MIEQNEQDNCSPGGQAKELDQSTHRQAASDPPSLLARADQVIE